MRKAEGLYGALYVVWCEWVSECVTTIHFEFGFFYFHVNHIKSYWIPFQWIGLVSASFGSRELAAHRTEDDFRSTRGQVILKTNVFEAMTWVTNFSSGATRSLSARQPEEIFANRVLSESHSFSSPRNAPPPEGCAPPSFFGESRQTESFGMTRPQCIVSRGRRVF